MKALILVCTILFLTLTLHAQNKTKKMMKKTFVLIHGSWHSAWNWHLVKPILEAQGHRVIVIELPGMGRDKTPIKEVTLDMAVTKIVNALDAQDEKVILVGHSKNGIMISQAAEHRPDKIEKLVYLAAYLIPNGKTQREYSMQDTQGVLKPYVVKDEETNSTTLRPEIYKEGLYHDCPDYITELAKLILGPEPFVTGVTPLRLTDTNFGRVPRVYIECTEDKAVTPFIQRKMYTEIPCEKVYSLKSSHSPFFSMPKELCEILLQL